MAFRGGSQRAVSVIFKSDLLRFHHISPLFGKSNILILQMCIIRRTIAYLCLNMINFDEVDFSERRSEEVMFLLTLRVLEFFLFLEYSPPTHARPNKLPMSQYTL